jgi:hypothetical protein
MRVVERSILLIVLVLLTAGEAQAQSFKLPTTRNAALRYWEAFALMEDQPIDDSTRELLEKVLSGSAAWDEQRLGQLVNRNYVPIQIMQGGTLLPQCEWGNDYSGRSMGEWVAPLPQVAKANVLGRLNLLYGMRALSQHDSTTAATTFIAGMHFAQHLSQDGPVISILTAKGLLLSDFQVNQKAITEGQLDSQSKMKIYEAVRSLPKDSFDWAYSVRFEGFAEETTIKELLSSPDPSAFLKSRFRLDSLPKSDALPSAADISELHSYTDEVAKAFQMPPDVTQERLNSLEAKRKSLNPIVQRTILNFFRLNDSRRQLETERQSLLQQLKS